MLPPGTLGRTDGTSLVELHPEQSQRQRRSTLAHELAHIELGHTDGCVGAEEAAARSLAARWLVPMPDLLDGLKWTRDWDELADELWVDVETLQDRLDSMSEGERRMVAALGDQIEGGV